jgi:DNA-binding NtrC family response regulator
MVGIAIMPKRSDPDVTPLHRNPSVRFETVPGQHGTAGNNLPQHESSPLNAASAQREPLYIRVRNLDDTLEQHALSPWRVYTFGRAHNADLLIDDDRVSRIHGTIFFHDGWVVSDANSSNGTFLTEETEYEGLLRRGEPPSANRIDGERHPIKIGDAILPGSAQTWIEVVRPEHYTKSNVLDDDDLHATQAAKAFRAKISDAAGDDRIVFLLGPTGAGKTHAAEKIHDLSRRGGQFIAVNCAALPHDPTQLRAMLFGHTKGAFTGALQSLVGCFYAADKGTLFLDEVESLNPVAQGFLLDMLEQKGSLLPLGAPAHTRIAAPDVRFIAASKLPLSSSGLRRDLQFRLGAGDLIAVPSLRERREDVPGLARAFLRADAAERGCVARFDADAIELLTMASWPGEIRQLRGTIGAVFRLASASVPKGAAVNISAEHVKERLQQERRIYGNTIPVVTSDEIENTISLGAPLGADVYPRSMNPRKMTAQQIEQALSLSGGNMRVAAESLGIGRRTLMQKMDRLGMDRPGKKSE